MSDPTAGGQSALPGLWPPCMCTCASMAVTRVAEIDWQSQTCPTSRLVKAAHLVLLAALCLGQIELHLPCKDLPARSANAARTGRGRRQPRSEYAPPMAPCPTYPHAASRFAGAGVRHAGWDPCHWPLSPTSCSVNEATESSDRPTPRAPHLGAADVFGKRGLRPAAQPVHAWAGRELRACRHRSWDQALAAKARPSTSTNGGPRLVCKQKPPVAAAVRLPTSCCGTRQAAGPNPVTWVEPLCF